jgi:hypothetical protein
MAAVIATLNVMERENGAERLWHTTNAITDLTKRMDGSFKSIPRWTTSGPPFNRITWPTPGIASIWRRLMLERGALIYSAHNVSLAFDDNGMARLRRAWEGTLEVMSKMSADDFERMEVHEINRIMRR